MGGYITLGTVLWSFMIWQVFTFPGDAGVQPPEAKIGKSVSYKAQIAQQGVFRFQQILNVKPQFYEGSMPLVYISEKKAIGMSEMITVAHDFGEFKNKFTYNDMALKYSGIADGAHTVDHSGRLLAEADLVKIIKGEGIHIEERHYGSGGKVLFRCKSFIEFRSGFKKEELEVEGKKLRDYFFLWPVSTH